MAYKVRITTPAHTDEYEAYKWYEEQRPGLGDEFLFELERAYRKISAHPEHYGFIDEQKVLRDYLIHRFPFLIVYRIKDQTVEVITVHHTSKHPSKKYGK
jgi:plasmid stabilization system protein ParE